MDGKAEQSRENGKLDRKRFTFSSKANALKEIETWGNDYASLAEPTQRSAGHLTENVTEARMLQSKIMDMSRERFKYITQAEYNKKFFLDIQKRKCKIMPKLLHNINLDYWLNKKTVRHAPSFTNGSASNSRLVFLSRMESAGEKCKDFEGQENPFAMPERPKPHKQLPEFYRIMLKEQEEAELSKLLFPTQPIFRASTSKNVHFSSPSQNECNAVQTSKSAKSLPETVCPQPKITESVNNIQRIKLAKTANPSKNIVNEPRYVCLKNALSAAYNLQNADDTVLQSIIQSHDSLHLPSKIRVRGKPKLQKTILEYLRSHGFAV